MQTTTTRMAPRSRFLAILALAVSCMPVGSCVCVGQDSVGLPPLRTHSGRSSSETPAFTIVSQLLDDEAFAGAHDVELHGDLAFVPGKGGSYAVVDIGDPDQPEVLWFNRDHEATPDSETVLPLGKHLLLGARDFLVVDVSDPKNVRIVKRISDRPRIDRINGMVQFRNYVIAASKSGHIDAFDISDRDEPRLFGVVETKERYGLKKPHDVDRLGDYIVVVDPNGFSPPRGGLGIFRVAVDEKLMPTDQWELVGKVEAQELIGANRVQVSGNYAFVAGSLSPEGRIMAGGDSAMASMTVLDVSNPAEPKIVASLPFQDVRGPNGMTVVGNVVFYAGGQTVCAVDISDPRKPIPVRSQRFPRFKKKTERTDNYHDLVYRDGYLYVSAQTDNGFLIMKVNDKRIRDLAHAKPQW